MHCLNGHREHPDAAYTAAYTGGTESGHGEAGIEPVGGAVEDPDVVRIVEAWPSLPANVRAAILALISVVE